MVCFRLSTLIEFTVVFTKISSKNSTVNYLPSTKQQTKLAPSCWTYWNHNKFLRWYSVMSVLCLFIFFCYPQVTKTSFIAGLDILFILSHISALQVNVHLSLRCCWFLAHWDTNMWDDHDESPIHDVFEVAFKGKCQWILSLLSIRRHVRTPSCFLWRHFFKIFSGCCFGYRLHVSLLRQWLITFRVICQSHVRVAGC